MKIQTTSRKALEKSCHSHCITFRATSHDLAQWGDEAKGGHMTLSGRLDEKVQAAFQILFDDIDKEERK